MENEKEYKIYHKIEPGKKIRVWKTTHNDRNFYKVQVTQTNYENSKDKYYIGLVFKKGVELKNQTDIIIKEAYENLRNNPLDQYNPIVYLMVTDFEEVKSQERIEEDAYAEYQDKLNENENPDDEFFD